ncbi:MAG: hypothetical protein CM15mP83_2750 [Flavobacteriaceae bacterium]|nr:MAG: hypothetical protein CM15mP83_2750 [Flavobacteriaceae bacterium]
MGSNPLCNLRDCSSNIHKSKSTLNEDYEPLSFVNIGASLAKIYDSLSKHLKLKV